MDFLGIFLGWFMVFHPLPALWIPASLPPLWIADQVRNDGVMLVCLVSPLPHPVDSRLRGNDGDGFTSGYLVRRRFLYLILRCEVTWQSTCFPRVDDADPDFLEVGCVTGCQS